MGMAASQARYLALTARKTNTEWEGQQINQARTALANQSANLFNRLLGLDVPTPPDKTKFTEIQYTYSDGENKSIIENYEKIGTKDPDYNYIVKHYYMADIFQGAIKKLTDPQVQLSNVLQELNYDSNTTTVTKDGDGITVTYKVENIDHQQDYQKITKTQVDEDSELKNQLSSFESAKGLAKADGSLSTDAIYGYKDADGTWHFFVANDYNKVTEEQTEADEALKIALTAFEEEKGLLDPEGNLTFENIFGHQDEDGKWYFTYNAEVTTDEFIQPFDFVDYSTTYGPSFVGNSPLTELNTLISDSGMGIDQVAELAQVLRDCPDSNISKYIKFDSSGNLEYTGQGIYTFDIYGKTYYTTLADLQASYDSKARTKGNSIDAQIPLNYYFASYVPKKVEETNHALLETDANGRFTSVKFDNDSNVYALKVQEVTDEAAYESAQNQYLYKKSQYEKTIADINAKTSIIHQEDRTLELRLKQLDTEQNALKTEMEAVQKVIKENVEKTFKTFSD